MTRGVTLVTRRTIRAGAKRLFDAWTQPEQLVAWWGPRPVTCRDAEIDLRVGGRYRIVNALPDGTALAIEGTFELIEPARKLVYTWRAGEDQASRVTVRFEPRGPATEVTVIHEYIPTRPCAARMRPGGMDASMGSNDGSERTPARWRATAGPRAKGTLHESAQRVESGLRALATQPPSQHKASGHTDFRVIPLPGLPCLRPSFDPSWHRGSCLVACEVDGARTGVMGIQALRNVNLIWRAYVLPEHQERASPGPPRAPSVRAPHRPIVGTWAAATWAVATSGPTRSRPCDSGHIGASSSGRSRYRSPSRRRD